MGGRYDATNVIPRPVLSIITNVSLDHMEHLGYSVLEIAGEKAGIIKPGGALVTAEESPEVRHLFEEKCRNVGAEYFFTEDMVWWHQGEISISSGTVIQECSLQTDYFELENLRLQMPGKHQVTNAATALLGVQVLLGKGLRISGEQVRQGLERVKIPGRFEVLSNQPLVILDVAHNVAGARALKDTLARISHGRKLVLILGLLDDKEQEKIAEVWGTFPHNVVVTKPDSHRSTAWEQFALFLSRYLDSVCIIEGIEEAVCRGWQLADKDSILCVTGSFYLFKRAKKQLQTLIDNKSCSIHPEG